MIRFSLSCITLLSSFVAIAQPAIKTTYYDADWNTLPSAENAAYYRDACKKDTLWVTKEYFINKQIRLAGVYSDDSLSAKEGMFVYYYQTGEKKSEGVFRENIHEGEWIYWHENGKIDGKGTYIKGEESGVWKWYFENGQQSSEETYTAGALVQMICWDSTGEQNHTAKTALVMPGFKGGEEALMHYLSRTIKYPATAQDNNIEGQVVLEFIVTPDGQITNIKVVKSVYTALDNEAVRVVGLMKPWSPGTNHNRPISVRYTLPVIFRLN